jgi:hypothetical protein
MIERKKREKILPFGTPNAAYVPPITIVGVAPSGVWPFCSYTVLALHSFSPCSLSLLRLHPRDSHFLSRKHEIIQVRASSRLTGALAKASPFGIPFRLGWAIKSRERDSLGYLRFVCDLLVPHIYALMIVIRGYISRSHLCNLMCV